MPNHIIVKVFLDTNITGADYEDAKLELVSDLDGQMYGFCFGRTAEFSHAELYEPNRRDRQPAAVLDEWTHGTCPWPVGTRVEFGQDFNNLGLVTGDRIQGEIIHVNTNGDIISVRRDDGHEGGGHHGTWSVSLRGNHQTPILRV